MTSARSGTAAARRTSSNEGRFFCRLFSTYFRALSAGKKTAFVAVLAALSVVVNCFSIDIGASNKIAFTYTVCFFAGYLLGGVPAFFVALFGDVIGYLVNPVGVYWLYGVTLGLYAFLMGVVMNVPLGKGHRAAPYIKAAAALLLIALRAIRRGPARRA